MAVLVGIVVLVLAAQNIPLTRHLRRVERDRLITALERDAFTLAGRSATALDRDGAADDPAVSRMVSEYRGASEARVVVTDETGTAVVSSDEESIAGQEYASRPEIATALGGDPVSGGRHSDTLATDLVYVAVPVLAGDDVIGAVRITYPARVIADRVDDRVRSLTVVAAITVLMAAIVALVVSASVTRPLRSLRRTTERLAGGDLDARAETTSGPPEVRDLAHAFNRMSQRTQQLVDEQRAFAGDASHQLRTPLTALRLRLEQANELLESDPAGARERLEAASAESERLQHVITGLLALARADGQHDPSEPVDVVAIARDRADMWKPLAEEEGVGVRLDVLDREMFALAVPGALEQILDNLLDNSLAASPDGTAIELRLRRAAHQVIVTVSDRGPGMTPDQIARSFDRFWRAADADRPGTGLGLAVVQHL
ncbi:MAG TPA: ATP-binding protein, partial [Ilumatobacteraceae bacterium]|nr:ATP-binding protein [Ilumatobacteraceae bacterium]